MNIAHPQISQLYARFKAWKGVPMNMPLDDDLRLEFEEYILKKVEN